MRAASAIIEFHLSENIGKTLCFSLFPFGASRPEFLGIKVASKTPVKVGDGNNGAPDYPQAV
jgi:hypothetical protein